MNTIRSTRMRFDQTQLVSSDQAVHDRAGSRAATTRMAAVFVIDEPLYDDELTRVVDMLATGLGDSRPDRG